VNMEQSEKSNQTQTPWDAEYATILKSWVDEKERLLATLVTLVESNELQKAKLVAKRITELNIILERKSK